MGASNDVEILLVEDSPQDAEMTLRALQKHNLANGVHRVEDGVQALEFVFATGEYSTRSSERPPKLVLLDLKLPKVDGLEVLRRMKSDDRTKRIPVVMLTSSKLDEDMLKSYTLGVNSYVVKPVEFVKLVEAVKQLGLYWLQINSVPR